MLEAVGFIIGVVLFAGITLVVPTLVLLAVVLVGHRFVAWNERKGWMTPPGPVHQEKAVTRTSPATG